MHVFLLIFLVAVLFAPGRHRLAATVGGVLIGLAFLCGTLLPDGGKMVFLLLVAALVPLLCMLPFHAHGRDQPATERDHMLDRRLDQEAYRRAEADRAWRRREGFFGGRAN